LFGPMADEAGASTAEIDLPPGSRVMDLRPRLEELWAPLRAAMGSVAWAVNEEYVLADHVLEEGDEVALIPPVSGG